MSMNETPKPQNYSARFVSFDGTDENGVRAEVYVNKNRGKVKRMEENTEKGVVDVHFEVPGLKLPIHGWTTIDSPLYAVLKEAQTKNEDVDFRLETQRKPNIDRTTPIQEFRENNTIASKNVRVILAGVNGIMSDEAVTNPKEDPKTVGGRYPATEDDLPVTQTSGLGKINLEEGLETLSSLAKQGDVRQTVLDTVAAQLLLNGATVQQINEAITPPTSETIPTQQHAGFSVEAPSWKEFNSDGKRNLGSSIIGAGVGIETVIADMVYLLAEKYGVQKIVNQQDVLNYYTTIVFAICDRIQVASYGPGARADRSATSHTRIRGLVYEMIRKTHPLPLHVNKDNNTVFIIPEEHDAWVVSIGQEGVERFKHIIAIATSPTNFKARIPDSLLNGGNMPGTLPVPTRELSGSPEQPVEASQASSDPVPAPTTPAGAEPPVNPAESRTEATGAVKPGDGKVTKEEALRNARNVLRNAEKTVPVPTPDTPEPAATPVTVESVEGSEPVGMVYRELLTPEMVEGEELAFPETVERFKTVLAELGLNINDSSEQVRISKLLKYTFGADYSNARKIPDVILENFIDYYESAGTEVLDTAIREALK